eukprot:TRINITY_DN3153_c0_g1_i1.p3 TRINITY_DN3153_c0_g1~~TRINITY_DN3153_c0_g1_i1.p3  ORF type:complete len:50 (+),score=4.23 TRINITY_DN3153_c0_g1_i1:403-552(+)
MCFTLKSDRYCDFSTSRQIKIFFQVPTYSDMNLDQQFSGHLFLNVLFIF